MGVGRPNSVGTVAVSIRSEDVDVGESMSGVPVDVTDAVWLSGTARQAVNPKHSISKHRAIHGCQNPGYTFSDMIFTELSEALSSPAQNLGFRYFQYQ
jgi:hypothetical protein